MSYFITRSTYVSGLLLLLFCCSTKQSKAQITFGDEKTKVDYNNPKDYEIAGIVVTGTRFLDEQVLINLSGLAIGEKIQIPGEKITKAIENLWKQGLFADIKIMLTKTQGTLAFLEIQLTERPRLSKFSIKGVSKGEADKIREKIGLTQGSVVTPNKIITTKNKTRDHFIDKGYLDVVVDITEKKDTTIANSEILIINVKKNKRIRVKPILIEGNTAFTDGKLKRAMKETKQKGDLLRIFSVSKFIEEGYEKDKLLIIEKYNTKGYRDARIVTDSVYRTRKGDVGIKMTISEGPKYFFRNITFVGNTKYSNTELQNILDIKKGDTYDQALLEGRLNFNPNGRDIRSLYMDDGYLFFNLEPVELGVENDSIDLEIRITEGKQAIVNKVSVTGNTKTNDHVIMREVRTRPGQLFSRNDIIRTQRELSQMGYFNPEKLNVTPKPNPADGTVDINYVVEEKSSDQLELSGGYGAGQFVGTVGVSFNNFSARNIFNTKAWRPLPMGDGQRLSLRVQTNGIYYRSYSISFMEPWLGGKKPNAFSVSLYRTVQTNALSKGNPQYYKITSNSVSVGLGKRLRFPDDFFSIFYDVTYQHYTLDNYPYTFIFRDGTANNLNFSTTLSRNSTDQPIYPRSGSDFQLVFQLTPPYSLFSNRNYSAEDITPAQKYQWIEYYKFKIKASWFVRVAGDLVVNTRAKFGFLNYYNPAIGQSPFERFYVGGSGLNGFQIDGRELIALRGYSDNSLTPTGGSSGGYIGGTVYDKYTMEIRYPVSTNPQATIYGLVFAEGGNCWLDVKDFNPFQVRRSLGVGVRLFLPMFGGLIGIDYGYGLDKIPNNPNAARGQFHFSIGASME